MIDYKSLIHELEERHTPLDLKVIRAIRELSDPENVIICGKLTVYLSDRFPEIDGKIIYIRCQQLKILIEIARSRKNFINKEQLINAIWNPNDEPEVAEDCIYSNISRLRKKLKIHLKYDPIESCKFLGYRLLTSREQI